MPGMCASFSGMYPTRARISRGAAATSSPSTRIQPPSGRTIPRSDLNIVLLPAPFGPSSPTAPGGNAHVTCFSACWRP